MNLDLYEDALYSANLALWKEPNHVTILKQKAKSQCQLFKFEESLKIYRSVGNCDPEI